jgi:hypothetical protein
VGSPKGAGTTRLSSARRRGSANLATHTPTPSSPARPGHGGPPPASGDLRLGSGFLRPAEEVRPGGGPKTQSESFSAWGQRSSRCGRGPARTDGSGGRDPPAAPGRYKLCLGAGRRPAPGWGRWFREFGGAWKGCCGGGWAQLPCPEQMFLPHRGAHGWEPGLLGPFQVSRLGVGGANMGQESSLLDPFSDV